MSTESTESDDVHGLIDEFLGIRDRESAERFAQEHDRLLSADVVELFIRHAGQVGADDPGYSATLLAAASVLCGDPTGKGAGAVASTVSVLRSITAAADPSTLPRLKGALEAISGFGSSVHPVIGRRLLSTVSSIAGKAFDQSGDLPLLEVAVTAGRRAADATPPDSPERSRCLNDLADRLDDLADRLDERHDATGDRDALAEAIATARRSVDATSPDEADLPRRLYNLSVRLDSWYDITGDPAALDEAVAAARRSVDATPPESPALSQCLHRLASRLVAWHAATGDHAALGEAVTASRRAVDATPQDSPDLLRRLNDLSIQLGDWYTATGDRAALQESITIARRAASIGSPAHPAVLNNLTLRLAAWYDATGDRAALEEAVTTARRTVERVPSSSPAYSNVLSNLSNQLDALHAATGDRAALEEAVTTARRAADTTPADSTDMPGRLNNLTVRLGTLYDLTGDRVVLEEAVAGARRAVESTPQDSPELPRYHDNLGNRLGDWYKATGDRAALEEAVASSRRAAGTTRPDSLDLPGRLNNLALRLLGWHEATGDTAALEEGIRLLGDVVAVRPMDKVAVARSMAYLVRMDYARLGEGSYRMAAQALAPALRAFDAEQQRLSGDVQRLRDLAHRFDGLLADFAVNQALAGDVRSATAALEDSRIWLPEPEGAPGAVPDEAVTVVWVLSSVWETLTITRQDRGVLTVAKVPVRRGHLRSAATAALDASRDPGVPIADRCSAMDRLTDLTTSIVATFPQTGRLLLIPLGICAQLPYAGARTADGAYLVDRATLTVAPSLGWALAARRPSPRGASVGAFHPGEGRHRLDLSGDREMFHEILRGREVEPPRSQDVLAEIGSDTRIAHLSCHGSYNTDQPLDSSLHLLDPLTVRAVLEHDAAPWLVNLSACETAIPDLDSSEQAISFPTAFLLAGAGHVLANLWSVGNTYATAVNRAFYTGLESGEHPAQALRLAQLALRGADAHPSTTRRTGTAAVQPPEYTTHPYWWAAFTHYGSPW
jgi:hypothetical protein